MIVLPTPETILLVALILGIAYVLVKSRSLARGLVGASILVDVFVFGLWLLGVDRPLATLCTKFGCTTITICQAFLAVKIPLTIYLVLKVKQLEKTLG